MQWVETLPVLSQVKPGEIRAKLPPAPPQEGEPFEAMLRDMSEIVLPGLTHWQSPNFFAFFPANNSGPSILGELLAAGLGVQGMLWATSPACTEVETHVLDWMADMLALPEHFKSTGTGGGVIQDSASSAALCAILAARERATNFAANERGTLGRLTAYVSSQTHSSVEKGVKIAGLGRENLRLIDVDSTYAMRPDALEAAIERDKAAGYTPCFACATVGTTSSNAIDPVRRIGEICRRHNVWLHVDGAMSGTAALCPEFRHINDGLELVDSYCFNPHKWMFTNFDCDCFYVADRAALIKTLSRAAGVPQEQGHRERRRHRLPRLADPAGPAVPRPEALVRHPPLRRRGTAAPHPRAREAGAGIRVVGRGGRAVRTGGPCPAEPGHLPPRRRGCRQPEDPRRGEWERQDLPDAHETRWQADAADVDRPDVDAEEARGEGVGDDC